jgi:sulfoxide reductase heme-binding subunit YedZ
VTPLRRLTGRSYWSLFRLMLGLFAFFYGLMHFAFYVAFKHSGNLSRVLEDLANQPYIFFGMLALGLMVPLALTSTAASIRWLGSRKWKWLHRLVYISLIGAAIHYLMIGKVKMLQPQIFAGIAAVLLLFRIVVFFVDRAQRSARGAAAKAG